MMLHGQQIRRVQHYKYLDVVLHEPLYHTMRLDYNQVAVCNSMLVVPGSCKPPTHSQLSDTNMFDSHSSNDHVRTGSGWWLVVGDDLPTQSTVNNGVLHTLNACKSTTVNTCC
ncbi:hypothetical protein BDEG_26599 [Batrachochytrium dendrobatidis JEL423]|uniref:Uncharacterized protein n=1 Tax=Batrachochytrium dendrobatidis (strain JEL423) TaxID=403673 RepID=A0A177WUC1_BATDL|nr:hypothetical protein BDEG_26599 [Batrachochytrium dendrobatidis JEL423]